MKKKIILIGLTVITMFSFMINSNVSAKDTTVTIDDETVDFSDEEYIERAVDDGEKLIIAETKELTTDTNISKKSQSLLRSGTTYDEVWLQNEIDNVAADGTVELLGDVVLSTEVILPNKNITINGNDYAISLEEDYHGKHFNANSKHGIHTFKNVTLLGHNTDNPGTTNNGRITGGGIVAGGSKLNTIVFDNCTVKGIHSTTSGAVVKLDNSPFIVKNNTVITGNSSDSNGGVLDMNNGRIEIYDSSMSYNSSYGGAGGVGHIPYGDGAAVYDSEFSYNYAAHEGGAFGAVWSGSKITVEGCTFTGNTTAGNGGAIALNGTMVFTDNDFIENVAEGQGGAVYQWGTAVYTSGSFVRNSAKSTGGAIHIVNNNYNKLSADGVTFSENRAARDGISWDVSNPKSAPAMGYDQHTVAEHYEANIVNIDTFSSAIAENVTYTNIYNNHDVNYDTSMAVCFFNDGGTSYKIISHYNNDSLKPPVGFTDVEGKVFLGWRVNSNEANNKGWIPEGWDTSEAYMWDEETMKLTGSVILMGVWADAYDVTYHLNDGSNETAKFSYEQNTEINILSLTEANKDWEVPEGQELAGWALTETEVEDEQLYQPEDLYELNASVDLYARYRSVDLSIIDDFKDDDGIIVIYRTGATGEVSAAYPLGYNSTYNLQLQLGDKDISDEQLEEVTWEVESAGGFSNSATYLTIEDGSDEVVAKKSGIVKLTATYKSSSASIYVVIPGDVNRDGLLAAQDATIIQRYYASGSMDDFTINDEFTLLLADMNGDGFISGQDATIIQRMRASVITPSN